MQNLFGFNRARARKTFHAGLFTMIVFENCFVFRYSSMDLNSIRNWSIMVYWQYSSTKNQKMKLIRSLIIERQNGPGVAEAASKQVLDKMTFGRRNV